MKTFKKIFASVMVTAMMATMGVSAFADNIQPRGMGCPYCHSSNTTTVGKEETDWEQFDAEICPDERYNCFHAIEKKEIKWKYKCNVCEYPFETEVTYTRDAGHFTAPPRN